MPKKAAYLTVSQAARLSRVCPDTIRRWRREGRIKDCHKLENGYWVYSAKAIQKLKLER